MPTNKETPSLTLSSYLFGALVLINVLLIGWVFIQGHLTTSVQDVQSYSVYRELETNGIVDVQKLNEFRDGEYANALHLFTSDDLHRYTDRIRSTTNLVLMVLVLDLIALFAWGRRKRPTC